MSYAASALRQELVRRLDGRCRVALKDGKAITLGGDRLQDFTSCADCREECGKVNATGFVFGQIAFELDSRNGDAQLKWECPLCGNAVSEETSLLAAPGVAREIEGDALCFRCRQRSERLYPG